MPKRRQSPRGMRAPSRAPRARGFSLLELLVVLVITTLLTAIMFPGMRAARDSAHKLMCASNMRQVSTGIVLYSSEYRGRIPTSTLANRGNRLDQMSLTVSHANDEPGEPDRIELDGIGVLVGGGVWGAYCDTPQCMYCPSHTNIHTYERYQSTLEESRYRLNPTGIAFGNYHYVGYRPNQNRISMLTDDRLVLTDGFRTRADFNHEVGMNKLYGDGSIEWWADATTFFYEALPLDPLDSTQQESRFEQLWNLIDITDRQIGYE